MNDINNESQKENAVGPLIGSIIIITVISLGGLYFWANLLNKKTQKQNNIENTTPADDLKSIEEDLKMEI
ncbi:MAG: hypothetical protein NUV47_01700 [Patescibacteria group bacterium]|nr:hypothetical protein [Patescibacteria group bacterium]